MAYLRANVPPVRRIGPRESLKENIEAAEFASLYTQIGDAVDGLEADLATFLAGDEIEWPATVNGVEGAIAQTELGT